VRRRAGASLDTRLSGGAVTAGVAAADDDERVDWRRRRRRSDDDEPTTTTRLEHATGVLEHKAGELDLLAQHVGALGFVDQCLKRDELVVEEREHVLDQLLELGAIAQALAHSDERVRARRLDHFGEALHRRRQMRDNGEPRRFVVGDLVHCRASMQQRLVAAAHFVEQNAAQPLELFVTAATLGRLGGTTCLIELARASGEIDGGGGGGGSSSSSTGCTASLAAIGSRARYAAADSGADGARVRLSAARALVSATMSGTKRSCHASLRMQRSSCARQSAAICAEVNLSVIFLPLPKATSTTFRMLVVGLDGAGGVEFALRTRIAGAQHGGSDLVEIAIEEVERGLAENDPELLVTIDHDPLGETWP
jgi:hypothetical protein